AEGGFSGFKPQAPERLALLGPCHVDPEFPERLVQLLVFEQHAKALVELVVCKWQQALLLRLLGAAWESRQTNLEHDQAPSRKQTRGAQLPGKSPCAELNESYSWERRGLGFPAEARRFLR